MVIDRIIEFINPQPDQTIVEVGPGLAEKLLTTDLLVLSGGYDSTSLQQLANANNNAWDTDVLLLDLYAANKDTVDGGAGEDIIFGQRGDDTLSGGGDDDQIFGDNAMNIVSQYTDLPKIAHTYRIIGESTDGVSSA